MGLELNLVGPLSWRAIARLEEAGRLTALLDLLDGAPAGGASDEVWNHVATPDAVRRVLEQSPIDFRILDRLLARVGLDAADMAAQLRRLIDLSLVTALQNAFQIAPPIREAVFADTRQLPDGHGATRRRERLHVRP